MAPDTAPEITRLSSFSTTIPRDLECGSGSLQVRTLLTHLHPLVAAEWHADRVVGSVTLDKRAARPPVCVARWEGDRSDHVLQLVLEVPVRRSQESLLREVPARLLEHLDEHVGGQVPREHRLRQDLIGLDRLDLLDVLLHCGVALLCLLVCIVPDEQLRSQVLLL